MNDFTIGDVVRLKSGGPKMTIKELDVSNNYTYCVWHDGASLQSSDFDSRTLEKYVPKKKPTITVR